MTVRVAGITRLEDADFVLAHRRLSRARGWRLYIFAAILSFAAFGGFTVELPAVGGFLGLAALLAVSTASRLGKPPALPEWQRQVRYELHDEHFRIADEHAANEWDWSVTEGYLEVDDAFYLAFVGAGFRIVPKRAFAGETEIEAVRAVLREKSRTVEAPDARLKRSDYGWLLVAVLVALMYGSRLVWP